MVISSVMLIRMLLVAFPAMIFEPSQAIVKVSLVDHNDPNYTDRCLQVTGELCDYCCLEDFEWCSRDIYNCEPVTSRNLSAMSDCMFVLAGVIFGFPLLTCILYRCMMVRFCTQCYQNTGGVSVFECFCRGMYFIICCGRKFS